MAIKKSDPSTKYTMGQTLATNRIIDLPSQSSQRRQGNSGVSALVTA